MIKHPERLEKLDARLKRFVEVLGQRLPYDILVVQGFRTEEEQAVLYAKGRTTPGPIVTRAKHATDSPHGRGAAVDLVPIIQGKPDWNARAYFAEMAEIGREMGVAWGAKFEGLADWDHYEILGWRAIPFDDDLTPAHPQRAFDPEETQS